MNAPPAKPLYTLIATAVLSLLVMPLAAWAAHGPKATGGSRVNKRRERQGNRRSSIKGLQRTDI
jgi:hypothetical protein